ncbi:hypothetical protein C0J52_05219 [Blattella germanica]|nr:hypothetical protein C0J52_05219 [Blattella germanica]
MNLTAVLLILVIIVGVESSQRVKRRLAFIKGSKFFLRLNFKAQSFPTTILFAYAAGYKLNFELPDDANKAPFRFHRRAIYENVESALDQHGLDGRSCILKFLCEAEQVLISTNNLFQKTLKLIFT